MTALALLVLQGCAALSQGIVPVDGADPAAIAAVARVDVDTDHPALLRAVDGKPLPGLQVSSRVRAFSYVLHPGQRLLWLSDLPYGFPFLPQHLKCYVMQVDLAAGARYLLRLDDATRRPVLIDAMQHDTVAEGVLVDEPPIYERGCRWR
jgi:hypothetical protein